jgi:hypothetical protein
VLTEIKYCYYHDIATGTDWPDLRGFQATFTNSETGIQVESKYASLGESTTLYNIICDTVQISTMVN